MPDDCCSGPDLKAAEVATLENGLPKPPCAGNFADVCEWHSGLEDDLQMLDAE